MDHEDNIDIHTRLSMLNTIILNTSNLHDSCPSSGFLALKKEYEASKHTDEVIFARFRNEFNAVNNPNRQFSDPLDDLYRKNLSSLPQLPKYRNVLTPNNKYRDKNYNSSKYRDKNYNSSKHREKLGDPFPFVSNVSPLAVNKRHKHHRKKDIDDNYNPNAHPLGKSSSSPSLRPTKHNKKSANFIEKTRAMRKSESVQSLFDNPVTPSWPEQRQPRPQFALESRQTPAQTALQQPSQTSLQQPAQEQSTVDYFSPIKQPASKPATHTTPLPDDKKYYLKGTPSTFYIGMNRAVARGKSSLSPEFSGGGVFISRETGGQIY